MSFTFGRTDTTSSYGSSTYDNKYGGKFSLYTAGALTSICAYVSVDSGGLACSIRFGVYSDSAGTPGALLGYTSSIQLPAGMGAHWRTLSMVSVVSLPAGTYWLCIHAGSSTLNLFRDTSGGTSSYNWDNWNDGLANPWGTHNPGSRHYCIYGNMTEAPVAPTGVTATRVSDAQATIAWSNAETGGAYSSVSVLRSTDGGSYTQVASVGGTVESYSDTTISANHTYTYKAKGVNAAGSATSAASSAMYTTPAAPTIGTATKTGAEAATVTWTDNSNSEQYFEVERRVNAGAWSSQSATIAAGSQSYDDATLPAGVVEYRARALRGALVSDWSAASNSVTTTCAPAAPTVTAWAAYTVTGATLRVNWQHNTLDGSAQTKAYITFTIDAVEDTYEYTGTLAYYDIDISGAAATEVVTAKVKTKGLHDDYGPDSSVVSTILADTPEVVITTPAVDEDEVTDLPLTLAWTTTDEYSQAEWIAHLYDATDTLLETWTGSTETTQEISGSYLANLEDFTVDLIVRTGSGFWSAVVERTFSTVYQAPTPPSISATFDADALSVSIVGLTGETGELPATDHLELRRIEVFDGVTTSTALTTALTSGSYYIDYIPRLDSEVLYRVYAMAANGAYSSAESLIVTASAGCCAINFEAGDASLLKMQWNHKWSHDPQPTNEKYVFVGRTKPVLYTGEHTVETISVGASNMDATQQTALRELAEYHGKCVFRRPRGYRANVSVDGLPHEGPGLNATMSGSIEMTVVE